MKDNIGPTKNEKMSPDQILSAIKTTLDHPEFYSRVYSHIAKKRKLDSKGKLTRIEQICREEYLHLTVRLDQTELQESCSVRNVLKSRQLAKLLLNEKGQMKKEILPQLIRELETHLYSLGPGRQYDAPRHEHMLNTLKALHEEKELQILVQRLSRPIGNPVADRIIRDTLQLPSKTSLNDYYVRWAALSAWLCYLRQSVGSCFATAPAILIQSEQPKQFLTDLNDLIGTGQLKRTFGGVEYSVPFSSSWGAGDLKRQFLIHRNPESNATRIWEAPGLLIALSRCEAIDPKLNLSEKKKRSKELVFQALEGFEEGRDPLTVSIEQLLLRILLRQNEITEEDLFDYQNRPQLMMSAAMIVTSSSREGKGKGAACAKFLDDYELAQKTFLMLADNALLKAWEFTLASFSESKSDFTRWNLYSSLGLGTNEQGGIGQRIYETLKDKVDRYNIEAQDYQEQYEQVYTQIKFLEGRMKQASTEKEVRWVKMDYQARMNEFRTLEEMRNKAQKKAQGISHMYETLLDLLYKFFPKYFQEVYDPDMHEVSAGPYDDSPAGFRLLCKHGRAASAAWTPIKNMQQFVDALSSFFGAAEHEMAQDLRIEGLEEDLSEVITTIVNHVKTREFMESAFDRMALAHQTRPIKNPLENLDKIEKKPWAYTSGGTMNTLMSCYFKREEKPTEVARWVESESELLVFLIDNIKKIPPNEVDVFNQFSEKSLLIHSPTHAFLLKPGLERFKQGWQNKSYTYIWVRDFYDRPTKQIIQGLMLDREMIQFLIEEVFKALPEEIVGSLKKEARNLPKMLRPKEFRSYFLDIVATHRELRILERGMVSKGQIDALLYEHLPFCPVYKLKESLQAIFKAIPMIKEQQYEQLNRIYEAAVPKMMSTESVSAKTLQNIAKGLLCLCYGATSVHFDAHKEVSWAAQSLGLALPSPFIFADTNWVKDMFAMVVNPGTEELELWRMDYTGSIGYPMSMWKIWLNGSRKDRTWGFYPKYHEYIA